MFISIIGIPWATSCLVIAQFNLCLLGRELIKHSELSGKNNLRNAFTAVDANRDRYWSLYRGHSKITEDIFV
jgi:uncharacterized membrane protein YccF (DUF307 family)